MITREFAVDMHQEFGELGLRPLWMQDADPYSGMAVAHDILEHFPSEPGPAEGELMALGAGLWIRGDGGYWAQRGNRHRPEVHVAVDVCDVLVRVREGAQGLRMPKRARAPNDQTADVLRYTDAELKDREQPRMTPDERRAVTHYIRTGYERAPRRYRGLSACQLAYLFEKIEKAADGELGNAVEGQRFRFTVSPVGEHVTVRDISDE